jgi:hypothetical protein
LVRTVCSQIDPFCHHANGARLIRGNTTESFAIQLRQFGGVTTFATGNQYAYIAPVMNSAIGVGATEGSNAAATWSWADFVDKAALTTLGDEYRIVSAGLKIINTTNSTADQGIVIIGTCHGGYTMNLTSDRGYDSYQRFPLKNLEAQVIFSPIDSDCDQFVTMAANPPWNVCHLMVQGAAASTAVLAYELILNLEVMPKLSSLAAAHSARPVVRHPPIVQHVVDKARENVKVINKGPADKYSANLATFLERQASEAIGDLGKYVASEGKAMLSEAAGLLFL